MTNEINLMGDGHDGRIAVTAGVGNPDAVPVPEALLPDTSAMTDADIAAMLRRVISICAATIAKADLAGIKTNFNIGDASNGFAVSCAIQKVTTEVVDDATTRTTVRTL
jgi:hypothetical protein